MLAELACWRRATGGQSIRPLFFVFTKRTLRIRGIKSRRVVFACVSLPHRIQASELCLLLLSCFFVNQQGYPALLFTTTTTAGETKMGQRGHGIRLHARTCGPGEAKGKPPLCPSGSRGIRGSGDAEREGGEMRQRPFTCDCVMTTRGEEQAFLASVCHVVLVRPLARSHARTHVRLVSIIPPILSKLPPFLGKACSPRLHRGPRTSIPNCRAHPAPTWAPFASCLPPVLRR